MSDKDTIYRQAALDAMETWDKFGCDPDGKLVRYDDDKHYIPYVHYEDMVHAIKHLPSAQPEVKEIGYAECANAMLKMWIDNVLTDGEYNRIMDRLNAHHNAERRLAESEDKE